MAEINKGSYCYKITGKKGALKATAFGEVAEGMPECTAATMAAAGRPSVGPAPDGPATTAAEAAERGAAVDEHRRRLA